MNEDRRKALRTQGRFSEDFKRKSNEKTKKSQPKESESGSIKSEVLAQSYVDILKEEPLKYTKNSPYTETFTELTAKKLAIEINSPGEHILSESTNGISRIFYEPTFMDEDEGMSWFETLCGEIPFDRRNIVIRGEEHPQPRLVAWYGPFPYTYSGLTLNSAEIPESVIKIKHKVEKYLRICNLNVELNSVLLNLYEHGHHSIAWHSDDELSMGVQPTIASVSLGDTRRFQLRKKPHLLTAHDVKNEADYFINLTNGSLLIMDGCMQKDWQHRVPKEFHDKKPRINLTFRTVYALEKLPTEIASKTLDHVHEKNKSFLELENNSDNHFHRSASEVPSIETNKHSEPDRLTPGISYSSEQLKLDNPSEFPSLSNKEDNNSPLSATDYEKFVVSYDSDTPSDKETTKYNVQAKSLSSESVTESTSNESPNYRNDNISDNCLDRGTKPNPLEPCPPFPNKNTAIASTSLNVHAPSFVPKFQLPAFSQKPSAVSKEVVQTTEDELLVDTERSTNATTNRQHLSERLLDVFRYPYDELDPAFLEELLNSLQCSSFNDRDKQELQFLCRISNDQTPENQKQICRRIQEVVLHARSVQSHSSNRVRHYMSVQSECINRMQNSMPVQSESGYRMRNSAQSDARNRSRNSEYRQGGPHAFVKNVSPRHQRLDRRNDAVHKRQ